MFVGDKRPQYIEGKSLSWAGKLQVAIQHVLPGKPQQTGYLACALSHVRGLSAGSMLQCMGLELHYGVDAI